MVSNQNKTFFFQCIAKARYINSPFKVQVYVLMYWCSVFRGVLEQDLTA